MTKEQLEWFIKRLNEKEKESNFHGSMHKISFKEVKDILLEALTK